MTKERNRQPRVLAINDMSCLGSCSLTVAMPVLASYGLEVVPLPTAVLSTHTGGFVKPSITDMTEQMKAIWEHWKTLPLEFEGIYSGYFCNLEQLDLTKQLIQYYRKKDTLVLIDPVMGDNGTLYTGFNEAYVEAMKSLVAVADVVTPNYTECMLLLGESTKCPTKEHLDDMMQRLLAMGPRMAVITGVQLEGSNELSYYVGSKMGKREFYGALKIEHQLHGCGDVYASCLCGAMIRGSEFFAAARKAAKAVDASIKQTMKGYEEHWYGLQFESTICEKKETGGQGHDYV